MELNVPAGVAIPEESPDSNLVRVGDDVYEIRAVQENVPPAVPAEAGPEVGPEQATTVELDEEPADRIAGPEPSLPPSDLIAAPTVRTVTLADLYWSQGEHSTARRIIGEILRDDPANLRAQAWMAAREGDDLVEADLLGFLETMAKEYGYDLS